MKRLFLTSFLFLAFIFIACEDKEETKFVIVFEPATEHDFGKVEVNNSSSKKIRIRNSDESSGPFTGTIEIDSPNFQMDFSGVLVLQKNESKEIYLTFLPSAPQEYSGKLIVQNDNSLNEFYLSGVGASAVSFSITPVALDFGLVEAGSTKDLDLTFENNSASGFDLEIALDLPLSDFIIGTQTNFFVTPGSNKTITVRYTPTQNVASKILQVTHNSSTRPNPAKIQLSGIKDVSAELASNNSEGWSFFKNKDYYASLLKFLDTVNNAKVNAVYDSISDEALLGKGWARLFDQRNNNYALTAFNEFLNSRSRGLLSEYSDIDALAGIAISGVLVASNDANHFNRIVYAANSLLSEVQGYEFQYNTNVDHKDVRYALIQAYFSLSNYSDAAKQLDFLVPVNAPHSSDPESILSAIQALAGKL